MKPVISNLILDTQSAFVKGWQVLDDILITNEVDDDVKKTKK